jgi:hypothetical protein
MFVVDTLEHRCLRSRRQAIGMEPPASWQHNNDSESVFPVYQTKELMLESGRTIFAFGSAFEPPPWNFAADVRRPSFLPSLFIL